MERSRRTRKRHAQRNVTQILKRIQTTSVSIATADNRGASVNLINSNIVKNLSLENPESSSSEVVLNNSEVYNYLSDSSSNSEKEDGEICFVNQIRIWALNHNITHCATRELLEILGPHFPNLPKDPRTLLATPRHVVHKSIGSGKYHHFGILNGIVLALSKGFKEFQIKLPSLLVFEKQTLLTLTIGIDGLPISKSNNNQFWPILGILDQSINRVPFIIGLFYGKSKPESVHEFLIDFVNEMQTLESVGLIHAGTNFTVRIRCIMADAPAKAYIKNCCPYNAYYGCDGCIQKGLWTGRVIYPELESSDRLDTDFASKTQPQYHNGETPLSKLQLGLVSQIPRDYMHLVCLGVVRKLILAWSKGPLQNKLGPRVVAVISSNLLSYIPHCPTEFARKPRSLREIDHYKATELRQFLLYTGPVCLKNNLPREKYEHFLLLHIGCYILMSHMANDEKWLDFAGHCIKKFVRQITVLYGQDFMVYNIHALLHLVRDCKNFGPLDNFSAFPFENAMQVIKRSLRAKNKPFQQAVNRFYESSAIGFDKSNYSVDQVSTWNPKRASFSLSGFNVSKKIRDYCCLTADGKVVLIQEFKSQNIIIVKRFINLQTFYLINSLDSSLLSIFMAGQVSNCYEMSTDMLLKKMYLVPYGNDSFVAIPLL